jgi:hypothetical protein
MAARTKAEIVDEVRKILAPLHIHVIKGENTGAFASSSTDSTTIEKAQLQLLAVIAELLANIRQNETNP